MESNKGVFFVAQVFWNSLREDIHEVMSLHLGVLVYGLAEGTLHGPAAAQSLTRMISDSSIEEVAGGSRKKARGNRQKHFLDTIIWRAIFIKKKLVVWWVMISSQIINHQRLPSTYDHWFIHDLLTPRHTLIFSADDWGVQSPPHSIWGPLPFSVSVSQDP